MVICIAGMHRSGTSLVSRLMNLCGLYLGREEDILPANPTNPEGHWEHERIVEINDELLAELGGGWDYPPDVERLTGRARFPPLEDKARAVLTEFAGRELWGWKDPRNCLTLPFWRTLVEEPTVVVAVRNPLEVALSLRRRGSSSVSFGLALWTAYNEAIVRATSPEQRVVTHYARYLDDPAREMRRLAGRIPLDMSSENIARVSRTAKVDSRHNYFTLDDLVRARVSMRVIKLYRQLCAEADFREPSVHEPHAASPDAAQSPAAGSLDENPGRFDYAVLERHLVRSRD